MSSSRVRKHAVGSLTEAMPDWPSGPLDRYRKRATFDWREMKVLMEGQDCIKFKATVWRTLESDPLFQQKPWHEMTREESRRMVMKRMKALFEYDFLTEAEFLANPYLANAAGATIGQYDWALCTKKFLAFEYFMANARTSGSKEQNQFVEDIKEFKALGSLSITELAHGSNTRGLKTRATFDPATQQFILNTPSVEATKVWSGVLGQTATHAVVFCQLYTPDGQCHGLHSFLVPVRDQKTLLTFPGVTIGDMGAKIGLNGLDNGFMQFNNYRIGKGCLMNRNADITPDGKYTVKLKDKNKRFGITLGILSAGRVSIIMQCYLNLQTAITIGIRYSAVRQQFGPPNATEEWPILEYQTQQWRLVPYICASYVIQTFYNSFFEDYIGFFIGVAYGGFSPEQPEMGAEIHCLSCSGKAIFGWLARDCIQECRECCGGHGYLKASRLGDLRNDHDANNTYEGDNNVILQQTSNYLQKLFQEKRESNKTIKSPLGSVDYIDDIDSILQTKSKCNYNSIDGVAATYKYIVCYLLAKSNEKNRQELHVCKGEPFAAKSRSQVYYNRTLAIAYIEGAMIDRFQRFTHDLKASAGLVNVMNRMGLLFGLWSLQKHMDILLESGYIPVGQNIGWQMKDTILNLCTELKDDAVTLVDVFSPPDFVLNSCLAYSDGQVYDHLYEALVNNKGAFDRPDWHTLFTDKKTDDDLAVLRAKL